MHLLRDRKCPAVKRDGVGGVASELGDRGVQDLASKSRTLGVVGRQVSVTLEVGEGRVCGGVRLRENDVGRG